MKYFLLIIILIVSGCSPKLKNGFKTLSKPEKTWVFFHPFKAKKAFLISKETEKIKDSIGKINSIGNDNNGGHLDAFKHSLWMAKLTQSIGEKAAFSLGKAHEKGNYKTFKKRKLEDGFVPDMQSSIMDLFNNKVGINTAKINKNVSKNVLIKIILDSLHQGKLRVLSKDKQGNFLDCTKKRIPLDSLKNKWNTKKCLVPSNN